VSIVSSTAHCDVIAFSLVLSATLPYGCLRAAKLQGHNPKGCPGKIVTLGANL
jgi:hypothetical protein